MKSTNLHPSIASGGDAKARVDEARTESHQALKLAPSEIKADVAVLIAASDSMYDALAKAGYDYSKLTAQDMSAFSAPKIVAAEEHLTAYIASTCGIDLTGGAAAAKSADSATDSAAAAAESSPVGDANAAADPACTLATVEEISKAAGKPMHSVGGAGTICVFSAVDDPSFALAVTIYNDQPSMAQMKSVESAGSEHVDGLGDDAFWNPTIGTVFVEKGDRAFSFSLPSFANLTSKPAAVKANMISLAQAALPRFSSTAP